MIDNYIYNNIHTQAPSSRIDESHTPINLSIRSLARSFVRLFVNTPPNPSPPLPSPPPFLPSLAYSYIMYIFAGGIYVLSFLVLFTCVLTDWLADFLWGWGWW